MIELLHTPPPFIRRYGGSWGVFVLAIWSLMLSLTGMANLLLATLSVPNDNVSSGQLYRIIALNVFFAATFLISAWGLIQRKNWGRLSFLWLIGLWAGANFMALFTASSLDFIPLIFNSFRFLLSFLLPIWYLNLTHIKLIFKDTTHHDHDSLPS